MKPIVTAVLASCLALSVSAVWAQSTTQAKKIRIGVYDNRAIAIAYGGSKYNPVAGKMAEMKKAKTEQDAAKIKELEAWGKKSQRQLHRQGFCHAPVNDLLELVKEQLPSVMAKTGVDVITQQCDYAGSNVEIVDISLELAALFSPSEKQLQWIKGIKDKPYIDLDDADKIE
jgi:hypothetical protein